MLIVIASLYIFNPKQEVLYTQNGTLETNSPDGMKIGLPSKIQDDTYKILKLYDIKQTTTPYEIIYDCSVYTKLHPFEYQYVMFKNVQNQE